MKFATWEVDVAANHFEQSTVLARARRSRLFSADFKISLIFFPLPDMFESHFVPRQLQASKMAIF